MIADHVTRSEIIDAWERQQVMAAGYPNRVGWTVELTVSGGRPIEFVVEFQGGERTEPVPASHVTVVSDISIPPAPRPFVSLVPTATNVVPFRRQVPVALHGVGDSP